MNSEKIYFTQHDAIHRDRVYQKFPEKSIAVPDQNLSIRQIMERFTNGQSVNGRKDELMFDDDGVDGLGRHPKTLDLTESVEMMQNAQSLIDQDKKASAKKKKEAEKEALKLQLKAELDAEKAAESTNTP